MNLLLQSCEDRAISPISLAGMAGVERQYYRHVSRIDGGLQVKEVIKDSKHAYYRGNLFRLQNGWWPGQMAEGCGVTGALVIESVLLGKIYVAQHANNISAVNVKE